MQRTLSLVLIPLLVLLLYSPADAQQEQGRAYYDFGVFAYEDGDYEGAVKNFKKALEASPDNPYYNHYLGKTYLVMESYEEAKKYLTVAWEKDPDISGLRYDFALLHYRMSNYGEAADRQVVGNVLRSVLSEDYHDRVEPFVRVLLEYVDRPVPEKRRHFGPAPPPTTHTGGPRRHRPGPAPDPQQ